MKLKDYVGFEIYVSEQGIFAAYKNNERLFLNSSLMELEELCRRSANKTWKHCIIANRKDNTIQIALLWSDGKEWYYPYALEFNEYTDTVRGMYEEIVEVNDQLIDMYDGIIKTLEMYNDIVVDLEERKANLIKMMLDNPAQP